MYWNPATRVLIFYIEDQLPQFKIKVTKKIPIKEAELHHFAHYGNIMELVRQSEIVKYYDEETLEFRCFKNKYGKGF